VAAIELCSIGVRGLKTLGWPSSPKFKSDALFHVRLASGGSSREGTGAAKSECSQ